MAEYEDREHFIPLRVTDLINFLSRDPGSLTNKPLLGDEERAFRRFAHMLITHYHLEYHDHLCDLKDIYGWFDPDADTKPLEPIAAEDMTKRRDQVFTDVGKLLEKANYTRLSREELEQVIEGSSAWGLEMHVNWEIFDRIEVYYRGEQIVRRSYRSMWRLWMKQEVDVPTFTRLVIMIKQKSDNGLPAGSDTENVYMKLFKYMPKMDLEMVLPGTTIKLSKFDKAMITYPVLMGAGLVAYKLIQDIFPETLPELEMLKKVGGTFALAALLAGYAYRSYYSYSVKKTTYTLQLTKSLYFQNLDSNAGVLHRLLDEAEEQEVREALLAYYYLWRHAPSQGWTPRELDDYIEEQLKVKLNLEIDFEIGDATDKLERLGLLEKSGNLLRVVPLAKALELIEKRGLGDSVASEPDTGDDLMQKLKL